jgi:hypothetical protein
MSKCDKLFEKAKNSPNNFSFTEICQLAKCYGFIFQRQSASHIIYEHPVLSIEQNRLLNFQNFKGKAKPYQVKQVLKAISYLSNE